ncbi:MAG TPA: tRNA uridine-5-carboxymethylaminomethyl(34) synthesis GTPase MnmE [Clostridia bacterium]|nr:tRNA uridine-5-carboxymethylaminomethyl(34) synthesis GTPase MnmE [Clostridia bacterium]
MEDTIAAISTPIGEGGIGIVRLSGTESLRILENIFKSKNGVEPGEFKSHTLVYGHIIDPGKDLTIDEALVSVMRSPASYTREDIVEINCHGGIVSLRKILELVISQGARLADPGEFSKRAFLNGRIDLAQAEAIIDIITARTDSGLGLAVDQLKGKLSAQINNLQQELLGVLAHIEAIMDFPEEDLSDIDTRNISSKLNDMVEEINGMLKNSESGQIYREGINAVIAGKPNVGKSSLLNALLREKRAIVTDVPGTTRDTIEEILNIKGIPVRLIDTAGLREAENAVEMIGVLKAKETLENADLTLLVLDAASGLENEDMGIIRLVKGRKMVVIINKIDLKVDRIDKAELVKLLGKEKILEISALEGQGLDEIEDAIFGMVMGAEVTGSRDILVSNIRHKSALTRAKKHLDDAVRAIKDGLPIDLVSLDIRESWETLGEITGSTIHEDIVDKIFEDFCIGK